MQSREPSVVHVGRALSHAAQGRRLESSRMFRQVKLKILDGLAVKRQFGVAELSQTIEWIVFQNMAGRNATAVGCEINAWQGVVMELHVGELRSEVALDATLVQKELQAIAFSGGKKCFSPRPCPLPQALRHNHQTAWLAP